MRRKSIPLETIIELRNSLSQLPIRSSARRAFRAKGKVERPFRTVKEMHETLYHLHEPETITEANTWLMQFLLHYMRSGIL
jgi:hypothetical protein